MKNKLILLSLSICIISTTLMATEQPESSKIQYNNAFIELKAMVEGKQPADFEKAVFTSENAYWNNEYSYTDFQKKIAGHLLWVQKLMEANDKSDTMNFNVQVNSNGRFNLDDIRYTEEEKKELYNKALKNWAIFKYITDTTTIFPFIHPSFAYASNDPFGMKDWSNSQVLNLITSNEQKGNCFALTGLYKILANRLGADAKICTAPQHIYIQHQDHKGDFYNVELATAGHPGDGMIQTLTYTTTEAIMSGIALRGFNEKESIGLCLVNLAKSYEHKFHTKNDAFILKCAELALKYDSLNLNALLLKQQVLDEKVIRYALKNNINDINQLKKDTRISGTVLLLQKHLSKLYQLGYRQMPLDMQQLVMNGFSDENNGSLYADKNPSPFTTVKPKSKDDEKYWSLSHGTFQEVFEHKKLENYGHFVFNTETKNIASVDTTSNKNFIIDPVAFAYDFGARMYDARLGRFISTDPHASKYAGWSPYAAFNNNPIIYKDPDGKDGIISIKGNSITVSAQIHLYGSGATAANAKQMQADVMKTWGAQSNGKGWSYTDAETGKTYDVKFDIKIDLYEGKEKNDPTVIPDSWNPSNRENFVEVGSSIKDVSRSNVQGGDEGEWRGVGRNGSSLAQDDPAPHEVGHILGLGDQYTDAGGTNKGWEGNMMGDSNGKVDQRNINGIVGDAVKGLNIFQSDKNNSGKTYKHEIDIDNPKK